MLLTHHLIACARLMEKKYEVFICCNVLMEVSGRRYSQKIINPRNIITFVKMMVSF